MLKLKNSILKIVMIMLVIVALVVPATAYASDGSGSIQIIAPNTTPSPTPSVTPTPNATTTPKPTATPSTKLPQTGIEDYTGLMVVTVLLAGSSVFAYKKMREL